MKKYVITIVLIATALYLLFAPHKTDEDLIRERFARIGELSSMEKPEEVFALLERAKALSLHFSKQTTFDLAQSEYSVVKTLTQEEIKGRLTAGFKALRSSEVHFDSFTIDVHGKSAHITVRGSGLGRLRGEEGKFLEVRQFEVHMEKDNTWQIKKVIHLANLRDE